MFVYTCCLSSTILPLRDAIRNLNREREREIEMKRRNRDKWISYRNQFIRGSQLSPWSTPLPPTFEFTLRFCAVAMNCNANSNRTVATRWSIVSGVAPAPMATPAIAHVSFQRSRLCKVPNQLRVGYVGHAIPFVFRRSRGICSRSRTVD